ncbi:MAG TPA: hypothetical protein VHY35_16020 [Stellaceae bacterium]|jgi:hypothetical protein|nr:hypothetical protein [Stellaceae bacterium]
MSYETYRVEITRDEIRASAAVTIEITAYIDRVPEHNDYTLGRLTRAPRGVWNSRLQYAGDFETVSQALAAIDAAYPDIHHIRCYEYSVDSEYPVEVAPLLKSADKWHPDENTTPGNAHS